MDTSMFQADVNRTMNPKIVGPEIMSMVGLKLSAEVGEFSDVIAKWLYQ